MQAKTKNKFTRAPSLKNGTLQTPNPGIVSSRFIYEATNHRRSRFYFEAIGNAF
jgi:hypothetical protein